MAFASALRFSTVALPMGRAAGLASQQGFYFSTRNMMVAAVAANPQRHGLLTAYNVFSKDNRAVFKTKTIGEASKELASKWNALSEEAKDKYRARATLVPAPKARRVSEEKKLTAYAAFVKENYESTPSLKELGSKWNSLSSAQKQSYENRTTIVTTGHAGPSGYNLYAKEFFADKKSSGAKVTFGDDSKKIAQAWKSLSEDKKQQYNDRAAAAQASA